MKRSVKKNELCDEYLERVLDKKEDRRMERRVALISGSTGQDGSYLSELLLKKDYEVHGIVRRGSTMTTERIDHLLFPEEKVLLHYGDLEDTNSIYKLLMEIKPNEIYNMGSMSHVRVSFDIPEYTGQITGLGVCRLLESTKNLIKHGILDKNTKLYQASSSEMFGLSPPPQNEKTPMLPVSPYGCAKLYGYHMTRAYRLGYKMFACNGILFNHECLTENTPIIISRNGYVDIIPIEELVPHRTNLGHAKIDTTIAEKSLVKKYNIKVWDGDKWTNIKTMTATSNRAGKKDDKKVISVTARGGYYEASSDHISFLKGGKEIKTYELQKGQELELKGFPDLTKKIKMTVEEAEFLGMLVGDGYVSDKDASLAGNNKQVRERFSYLWKSIMGGNYRETILESGFIPGNKVYHIDISGNPRYCNMIRKEIYTEQGYKRVPFRVLNADEKVILAFLRGYNVCDGLLAGGQKTEFQGFSTNSQVLVSGLWYLFNKLGYRLTLHPEFRDDKIYYGININSNNVKGNVGRHLVKSLNEIKVIKPLDYTGWLFDLETESGTFSAGIGSTWVHNSPRRGETFVTKKIVRDAVKIKLGKQDKIHLGNLDARRDWGFAGDYMEAIYAIMHHNVPDDFVVSTEHFYSVKEFAERVFKKLNLDINNHLVSDDRYRRPNEVPELRGDSTKIRNTLGWKPKVNFEQLVDMMIDSVMKEEKAKV